MKSSDIESFLSRCEERENFFIEFKSDEESPKKFIKEVSAFANTFGGYIFLGVKDDKTIGGCTRWTEDRVHTTMNDSLSPIPEFDVRRFTIEDKSVLIVRIEEGLFPPYVTNEGLIYERVSSGSYPIKEQGRLTQIFDKRKQAHEHIKKRIEIPNVKEGFGVPNNTYGYLDIGFFATSTRATAFHKKPLNSSLPKIAEYMKSKTSEYSISLYGGSVVIVVNTQTAHWSSGESALLGNGMQNYIEIMSDGSIKCRILLIGDKDDISRVNITGINWYLDVFKNVYSEIMGPSFSKAFISAHRYEKLTVLKQFTPYYYLNDTNSIKTITVYKECFERQMTKYGGNIIVNSSRFPIDGYEIIDRRWFSSRKIRYTNKNLYDLLFYSIYSHLGFVEPINK